MKSVDRAYYRGPLSEPLTTNRFAAMREVLAALPRRPAEVREVARLLVILRRLGWQSTLREDSIEADPLPWMNLSAVAMLGSLCPPNTRVVEFGCGASTLWLADRGCHVRSFEHDSQWYQRVTDQLARRPSATHCEITLVDRGSYARAASSLVDRVDVVLVDGIARVDCVRTSLSLLSQTGWLVLDDSHRADYDEAFEFLDEHGFVETTLWGPKFGLNGGAPATSFFRRRLG